MFALCLNNDRRWSVLWCLSFFCVLIGYGDMVWTGEQQDTADASIPDDGIIRVDKVHLPKMKRKDGVSFVGDEFSSTFATPKSTDYFNLGPAPDRDTCEIKCQLHKQCRGYSFYDTLSGPFVGGCFGFSSLTYSVKHQGDVLSGLKMDKRLKRKRPSSRSLSKSAEVYSMESKQGPSSSASTNNVSLPLTNFMEELPAPKGTNSFHLNTSVTECQILLDKMRILENAMHTENEIVGKILKEEEFEVVKAYVGQLHRLMKNNLETLKTLKLRGGDGMAEMLKMKRSRNMNFVYGKFINATGDARDSQYVNLGVVTNVNQCEEKCQLYPGCLAFTYSLQQSGKWQNACFGALTKDHPRVPQLGCISGEGVATPSF